MRETDPKPIAGGAAQSRAEGAPAETGRTRIEAVAEADPDRVTAAGTEAIREAAAERTEESSPSGDTRGAFDEIGSLLETNRRVRPPPPFGSF